MLDVYNSQRKKTGKVIERGAALAKGEYQLAAAAVIINQEKFLITQRLLQSKWAYFGRFQEVRLKQKKQVVPQPLEN
jgi:hypothetical protein